MEEYGMEDQSYQSYYPMVVQPHFHLHTQSRPSTLPMPPTPTVQQYGQPPSSHSNTQSIAIYVCAVSFMCIFVVAMVYTAIDIKRKYYETTQDATATNQSHTTQSTTTSTTVTNRPLLRRGEFGRRESEDYEFVPYDYHFFGDLSGRRWEPTPGKRWEDFLPRTKPIPKKTEPPTTTTTQSTRVTTVSRVTITRTEEGSSSSADNETTTIFNQSDPSRETVVRALFSWRGSFGTKRITRASMTQFIGRKYSKTTPQ